jgi:hypothetical protein
VVGARLVVNRILHELERRQSDVIEVQVIGAADSLYDGFIPLEEYASDFPGPRNRLI